MGVYWEINKRKRCLLLDNQISLHPLSISLNLGHPVPPCGYYHCESHVNNLSSFPFVKNVN